MRWRLLAVLALVLLVLPGCLSPEASAQVEQVHLGLTDAPPASALVLSWYSQTPQAAPEVTLTGPSGQERVVEGEAVTGPAAGFVYEAELTELDPGTTYTYQVGSHEGTFTTPIEGLEPGRSFRFAALGDMGVTAQAEATVETLQELDPELVLHTGDISYAEGSPQVWNTWFGMVEPVAAHVPWVPTLGNHENVPPATEPDYVQQRFPLPHNELWFSFDWRGVHIVGLDTYSTNPSSGATATSEVPAEEIAWLEEDLSANADAPWTVVYLHDPPYSSNSHGSSQVVQDAFVDLFEEHGVDLVIAGHDHGYERSWPLVDGEPTADDGSRFAQGAGVVYLVTGGAGNGLYDDWEDPAPAWSAARAAVYHVVSITATPDLLQGRVVTTTGDGFQDSFSIHKGPLPNTTAPPDGQDASTEDTPLPGPALLLPAVALAALVAARRLR